MTILSAKQMLINQKLSDQHVIEIKEKKISRIMLKEEVKKEDLVIHYEGTIVPGFIDTHIHGYKGMEFLEASPQEIQKARENLIECGVTSFYPTLQTAPIEKINRAIHILKQQSHEKNGAKIEGIFLEGPFLAKAFSGAQDVEALKLPSIELLEQWQKNSNHFIKKIAIAPELTGSKEFIVAAVKLNCKVALAHSGATAIETETAVKNGATILVHTFNAMKQLHHREPGILGEGLINEKLYAEIICDGYHLERKIVELITRAKGIDKTILITDGTIASGLSDGKYQRGEIEVTVKDGAVRNEDGRLAGSSLTLHQAIKNMVKWGYSLEETIQMASKNPAKALGIDDKVGELKPGSYADFVILDDQLEILSTWIDGREQYIKKS
jgi:N-acetylglucosamine-6-phosphate deacetylase